MICIIECGVSQLSRGGIRRRTWRFQSSTCDSDFATYDFPVAAPLEELSRNERDSPVAREFESKRNFKIDNKKERERERERGGETRRSTHVELQPVTYISQIRSLSLWLTIIAFANSTWFS